MVFKYVRNGEQSIGFFYLSSKRSEGGYPDVFFYIFNPLDGIGRKNLVKNQHLFDWWDCNSHRGKLRVYLGSDHNLKKKYQVILDMYLINSI